MTYSYILLASWSVPVRVTLAFAYIIPMCVHVARCAKEFTGSSTFFTYWITYRENITEWSRPVDIAVTKSLCVMLSIIATIDTIRSFRTYTTSTQRMTESGVDITRFSSPRLYTATDTARQFRMCSASRTVCITGT